MNRIPYQVLRTLLITTVLNVSGAPIWAAESDRELLVMTSYPDAMVSRFEAAFESMYPQFDMTVLWRQSADAMSWLELQNHGGVDVYWAPSAGNFERLADAGEFAVLANSDLPFLLGKTTLRHPKGLYAASELAGYGIALNPQRLTELDLPAPETWRELSLPAWRGQLVLPAPTVGFAPVMIDIILQTYGWDAGWNLWRALAANADFSTRGGSFVTDGVGSGRYAAGVTIDFFATTAMAAGEAIDFVYPAFNGFNPAHIAVMADTGARSAANAFVDFVLSDAGQALMMHPDIRKLPVRPHVYDSQPTYPNPFLMTEQSDFSYDNKLGAQRLDLVAVLFEEMIMAHHALLRTAADASLWLQANPASVISESEAMSLAPLFERTSRQDSLRDAQRQQLRSQWRSSAGEVYRALIK